MSLLKRLLFRAVAIIALLILIQFAAWAVAVVVLHAHPQLISTTAIAWILGPHHALDVDHISCIDTMTRRLIAAGQKPVAVGTFSPLGHSNHRMLAWRRGPEMASLALACLGR